VHVPDPLHPAVVHFPIVFILVGAALAGAAVVCKRLALLAFVCLTLGVAGAVIAVETGHKEKRDEIAVPEGEGRRVLQKHEKDGEATRNWALGAAILAGLALLSERQWPRLRKTIAVLASVAALLAVVRLVEAGRTGGELVYQYGVGLRF